MRRSLLALSAVSLLTGPLAAGRSEPDLALQPPPVNTSPGPSYLERRFQGIPGIERAPGGRLWATWYAGGRWEGPENYVLLVTSGDAGKTWSQPKLVIDPPGYVRAFDACLWLDPDGRLWLFWAQGAVQFDGRSGVWAIHTDNPGSPSPTWSAPRRLSNGVMMNKPTVLKSGEWLLPVAVWTAIEPTVGKIAKQEGLDLSPATIGALTHNLDGERGSNLLLTKDRGQTFTRIQGPLIPESHYDEHMMVERRDRSWWVLTRTKYGIGQSVSFDRGKTWSAGADTRIPHANSRFFIRRLRSGRLLLVRHESPEGMVRSHLTAQVSDDDGITWRGKLPLDERRAVSYPDGFEDPNGKICIIYDRERTKDREILFATFTEADVLAGACVSEVCGLKQLVNRMGETKVSQGGFR